MSTSKFERRIPSRRIGIVLFEGFSLLDAGMLAEVFHNANTLSFSDPLGSPAYEVQHLSHFGGRIACSSSFRVWTEGFIAKHGRSFDALFISGGTAAVALANNEPFLTWLRGVSAHAQSVYAIAEGRLLLDAAAWPSTTGESRKAALDAAIALITEDLGPDLAEQVMERLAPETGDRLGRKPEFEAASGTERIRASARWLQKNGDRPISVAEAAQIAAMSERNFLRRFKLEMGITPSEYLLRARLDMTCRMLLETDLPVDKIARRCGIGNGDRLAKIFRRCLSLSPTEYRLEMNGSSRSN